jgi:peptide deformylase
MIIKDEKFLRQVSTPVSSLEEGMEIADKLLVEINTIGGFTKALGLSAPQIGILKRVFVAWGGTGESGVEGWNIYVNPELEEVLGDERIFFKEGCLSFPGSTVRTHRSSEISISCLEEGGVHHSYVLYGQDAVVFQHELDHLDGVLFFDRVATSVPQEDNAGKNKVGRNDLCPCGSKKKYKKCCGK